MRDINADPFRSRNSEPRPRLDPVHDLNDFRTVFNWMIREVEPRGREIIAADTNRHFYEKQIGYLVEHALTGPDDYGTLARLPDPKPSDNGSEQVPLPIAA